MQVRMKQGISGTFNGVEWPPIGEIAEVPDGIAADMFANGQAEPVVEEVEPDAADENEAPADDVDKDGSGDGAEVPADDSGAEAAPIVEDPAVEPVKTPDAAEAPATK